MVITPTIRLFTPSSPLEFNALRGLLREYARGLKVDLGFQDFDAELATLPGAYAQPRGALLVAAMGEELAGCCALRPLDTVDYPNACEMKRLYVRPIFRRSGIGRQLAEAIVDNARMADYACILLDTLSEMEMARTLYQDLGFQEILPYYHSPIEGAHYLKVDL